MAKIYSTKLRVYGRQIAKVAAEPKPDSNTDPDRVGFTKGTFKHSNQTHNSRLCDTGDEEFLMQIGGWHNQAKIDSYVKM